MSKAIGRRQFIKGIGLGAMGLALLPDIARAEKRGGLKLQGTPQNVVILGGGLAGLSAGYELKRAGHHVTILEARNSPGGRVRTIRDFANGQYAEAGALNFPQEHTFTYGYATDFRLPLRPIFTILDTVADVRGKVFRVSNISATNIPLQLKASEQ